MADNHLSELSRKGRYGDTELAHVNPQEKSMLKAMGGSGTINPYTGLREYFTIGLPEISQFALTTFQGIDQHQMAQNAAADEITLHTKSLGELDLQEEHIEKGLEEGTKYAFSQYHQGIDDLTMKTGQSEEQVRKNISSAQRKTGLATSGQLEDEEKDMYTQLIEGFKRGRTEKERELGVVTGQLEGDYALQKQQIKSTRESTKRKIALAEKRRDAKFMGMF